MKRAATHALVYVVTLTVILPVVVIALASQVR
jgi:cell division protein FtsX